MDGLLRRVAPAVAATVAIVSLGFIVATVILRAILPDENLALGLAGMTFAGLGPLHRELALRFERPERRASIATPEGYTRPWWVMALVALVALSAAMLVADVGPFAMGPIASVSPMISTLFSIAAPLIAFALGSWIGGRATRPSLASLAVVIAVLGAFLLARSLTLPSIAFLTGSTPPPGLLDTSPCADDGGVPTSSSLTGLMAVVPPGSLPPLPPGASPPGDPQRSPGESPPSGAPASTPPEDGPPPFTPNYLYGTCVIQVLLDNTLLLVGGFGLIGAWRGGATREARYLASLLTAVPADTRATIVALAYEEATRPRTAAAPSHRDTNRT